MNIDKFMLAEGVTSGSVDDVITTLDETRGVLHVMAVSYSTRLLVTVNATSGEKINTTEYGPYVSSPLPFDFEIKAIAVDKNDGVLYAAGGIYQARGLVCSINDSPICVTSRPVRYSFLSPLPPVHQLVN